MRRFRIVLPLSLLLVGSGLSIGILSRTDSTPPAPLGPSAVRCALEPDFVPVLPVRPDSEASKGGQAPKPESPPPVFLEMGACLQPIELVRVDPGVFDLEVGVTKTVFMASDAVARSVGFVGDANAGTLTGGEGEMALADDSLEGELERKAVLKEIRAEGTRPEEGSVPEATKSAPPNPEPELLPPKIDPEIERLAHRLGDLLETDLWMEPKAILYTLSEFGPNAKMATPVILRALDDRAAWQSQVRFLRRAAAHALWKIAPGGEATIDALLQASCVTDFRLRALVAKALGSNGKGVEAVKQRLCEMAASDSSSFVRESAVASLGEIHETLDADTFETVCKATHDKSSRVRLAALTALSRRIGAHPDYLDIMRPSMHDPHAEIRSLVVEVFNDRDTAISLSN